MKKRTSGDNNIKEKQLMTQKEKAKAYDEAVKEASIAYKDEDKHLKATLKRIFPELKESKESGDERIREAILNYLKKMWGNCEDNVCGVHVEDAIAWLEKQKEFVSADFDDVWETADCDELTAPLEKYSKDAIKEMCHAWYDKGIELERKSWLEKQDEKITVPKWKYKNDNTPLLRDSLILNKYGCVAKSPSGAIVSDVWVIDYEELAKLPKEDFEQQDNTPLDQSVYSTEDEEIYQAISIGLTDVFNEFGWSDFGGIPIDNIQDWLEKQGEQKPADEKEPTDYNSIDPCFGKPVDKVEPKFKVGDIIVNDYCVGRVVEITNDAYLLDTGQGIPFSCKSAHLWTIQDAKEGDVLYSKEHNLLWIYKNAGQCVSCVNLNYSDDNISKCVSCVNLNYSDDNISIGRYIVMPNDTCPATKEQCETLIKAMAEAGYTFDFEEKELKRIESKFKVGDVIEFTGYGHKKYVIQEIHGMSHYTNSDGQRMEMAYTDANFNLVEQNLEWSEEDEGMLDSFLHKLEVCDLLSNKEFRWIRGKLNLLMPQKQWRPSDEQIKAIKLARSFVTDDFSENPTLSEILVELETQLKKLREE